MSSTEKLYAVIDYGDKYVQPLLVKALQSRIPADDLVLVDKPEDAPSDAQLLQWVQYEQIDFERLMQSTDKFLTNSYIIRKALIRKHYLANTVSHWLSKHPESDLRNHVHASIEFEVDFAEFLDDALLEAYELHESWQRNAEREDADKEWWILKPGMSERGQGIRLFSSEEELQSIFEEWDPASDDEDEAEHSDTGEAALTSDITTSQLRHFVAQPYIDRPLLLPAPHPSHDRKFHIRVYVVAVGALKVYIYKQMLALFAGPEYRSPTSTANDELSAHLTNTCLQDTGERDGSVHPFWSLPETIDMLPEAVRGKWQDDVWQQICRTTSTIFEAAARSSSIHFQALPNAFEIYGLDYLVDAEGCAWLLEVNAFPDFAQTGAELNGIIEQLMSSTIAKAVLPFFNLPSEGADDLVKVLDIDLGRR